MSDWFNKVKNKNWFILSEVLIIICMVVALSYIAVSNSIWNNRSELDNWKARVCDGKWYYVDVNHKINTLSFPAVIPNERIDSDNESQEVVIRLFGRIPRDVRNGEYLATRIYKMDVRIYVDGKLRLEDFIDQNSLPYKEDTVSRYVYLPLSEDDAGDTVVIEAVVNSPRDYYSFDEIICGEKIAIVSTYLKQNQGELLFGVFLLAGAIICIFTGILVRVFVNNKFRIDYMGWTLFWVALWSITQSSFRDFLFRDMKAISFVPTFCLMMVPMALALYFNSLQEGRYSTAYFVFLLVAFLHVVIRLTLQLLHISDFYSSLTSTFVLLFAMLILVFATIIADDKKGYDKDYWVTIFGILSIGIGGIVQTICFFMSRFSTTPFPLCIGTFIATIFAVVHAIQVLIEIDTKKNSAIRVAEVKSQFLASMSHEIRTPINAVLGMNEMILRESHEDFIKSYATDVDISGKMLLSLINDILDFSKLDSGKMSIVQNEYDLKTMILTCCNFVRNRALDKKLELKLDVDENLPRNLLGDDVRITQVITNFLTNAVKYTKEGSVELKVFGEKSPEDDFLLVIRVSDTGIGIKEENIDQLFSAFSRFDEKKNKAIEGTGLGLAISHELVKLMNGNIIVESVYGEGSSFEVTIPQKVIGDEVVGKINIDNSKTQVAKRAAEDLFKAENVKLLIVDDVSLNLKVAKSLLKNTGVQIETAGSGDECISKVIETKYDVILLDHMMPGKDGIETLREMKTLSDSKNVGTPVIMLTANAVAGARDQFITEGFDDYLSKPFSLTELQGLLLKYLPKEKIIDK